MSSWSSGFGQEQPVANGRLMVCLQRYPSHSQLMAIWQFDVSFVQRERAVPWRTENGAHPCNKKGER